MKKISLLILLFATTLFSQRFQRGDVLKFTDSLISASPKGIATDEYKMPSFDQLLIWGEVVNKILSKDYFYANWQAAQLNYELIRFSDSTRNPNKTYYILCKSKSSKNYWGTYFFNHDAARNNIVIQSPHPIFDTYTGIQGAYMFKNVDAFCFCISGTHRCNSSLFTNCSGSSTVCGNGSEAYKISDQAHTVNGMFQKTTEILLKFYPGYFFIQPHAFVKGTNDPDLQMSNGTTLKPNVDYLSQLKENFLKLDPSLTFQIGHINTSMELLASTNTQGRLINKSSDPCGTGPKVNTGHFIHIEQAYQKLRDTEENRAKLAEAIALTFPAESTSLSEKNFPTMFNLFQNYPNPFNPGTVISYQISDYCYVSLKVYDVLGREVAVLVDEFKQPGNYSSKFIIENSKLSAGVYFYQLKSGNYIQTKKMTLTK